MISRLLLLIALAVAPLSGAEQGPTIRNPTFLRASELLKQASPGVAPRVRFEWEQVPRAREYVLTGQWTDVTSWTVHTGEYRVNARNASTWANDVVSFEVSLPEGTHSWKLVAVFGPHDTGDFESPAHVSFTLR